MPTDEKDIVELVEDRMRELLDNLGKSPIDNPKREAVVRELESYSKIVDQYEARDQRRMDNNAKNDIEEQRIVIDQMKVLNDKARNRSEMIKWIFYILGSGGFGFWAYNMDKMHLGNKRMLRFVDDLLGKLGR